MISRFYQRITALRSPRKTLSLGLGIAVVSAALAGVPVMTQQQFDPSAVTPTSCKGKLKCFGLESESKTERSSVPKDPANYVRHRGLPSRTDMSGHLPPVGSQGRQGSCVGWSTTYYAKSLQERIERRWRFDAGGGVNNRCSRGSGKVFSPAWTYNQINGGRDRGSSIRRAFALIVSRGAAPCSTMPYNVRDYRTQPSSAARRAAAQYRGRSYSYVACHNTSAVKAILAKGVPLVGGFKVTRDLYRMGSRGVWDGFDGNVKGGHAMAVVGYDDSKRSNRGHRGAFKFVNSWGTRFGQNGYGWISYRNWGNVCKYLYVMYDRRGGGGGGGGGGGFTPKPQPTPSKQAGVKPPLRISASKGRYTNKVIVAWSRVAGATAFAVERAAPGSSRFRRLAYARRYYHIDRAVQANVAYKYRIVSIGSADRSRGEDSPVVEGYARTNGGGGGGGSASVGRVMGVRGISRVSGSRAVVALGWTRVPGARYYQVAKFDQRRRKWRYVSRRNSRTVYVDYRPTRGARNYYAVRAIGSGGRGKFSQPVRVYVGGRVAGGGNSVPTWSVPGRVAAILASPGTYRRKIVVTWRAVPGATGYVLYRYDSRARKWRVAKRTRGTRYTDSSGVARSGRWVYYSVRPYNRGGRGRASRMAKGRTSPNATRGSVLAPPKGVAGKLKAGKLTLSWKKVKGASAYYVMRKEQGQKKYKFIQSVTGTNYTAKIPTKGKLYLFVVRSKSLMGGESEDSQAVSGFINEEFVYARHRFIPGEGLKNFVGTWKATHLNNSAAHKLEIKVEAQGGTFKATITADGGRPRTISGGYAAKSRTITQGGFQMTILNEYSALIEINNKKIYPEELELVFSK